MTFENAVQKIEVDNVRLTANYYREYLGFTEVSPPDKSSNPNGIILRYEENEICLETKIKKKFSSSFTTKPVNLRFKNPQTIASLFEKYKQQVKIVNTNGLQDNRITEFAIKDCNGLLVLFTS